MKTLIIDNTSTDKLHTKEFTSPIIDIIKDKTEITLINFKELDKINIENFDKIILSGTALKDFKYLENLELFENLKNYKKSVLGICAGSQIIAKLFGCELYDSPEIGLIKINIKKDDKIFLGVDFKEVYSLHSSKIKFHKKFEVLIENKNQEILMFKKDNFYGILFHPEVRNKKLIKNFIEL